MASPFNIHECISYYALQSAQFSHFVIGTPPAVDLACLIFDHRGRYLG